MQRKRSFNFKRVLPLFLLMFGAGWRRGVAQVNREEANEPPDRPGGDAGAFFALRSCHQLLHSDGGEFFSPDYLCSNPSLWCNWTIRVDPGKRIHLHLEDLTPDDACHLKQDEIHVDDPAAHSGGHKVLQKCWREAKYTSSSNALEVVLLIGGWPHLPYRGFYGRYQAFGPPVIYNPHDGFKSGAELAESDSLQHVSPADSNEMFDDYDPRSAAMAELPWEPEEEEEEEEEDADAEFENLHPVSGNYSPFSAVPTVPTSTQGTSRSARGVQPEPPQQLQQHQELKPDDRSPAAVRRNVEEERDSQNRSKEVEPDSESELDTEGEDRTEVDEASDQRPSTSEAPEPEETEQIHPHPNVVEPLSDHRGNPNGRNHSETPHLPGDHMFEAAVEVNFSQDLDEHWDELARSLLSSVKASISERLQALHIPLTLSSKRIKRLNAGVLYILWLQIGPAPGGRQVHRAVHSAMQGLIATSVGLGGIHRKAVIVSVSTADVNECGTQLVLCDINADCVNQFGSYSCRCRPGFLDKSRLGSGGTVCVDMKAAGCSSGVSAETKGVYALFFLLSSLILLLLVAAGVLYRRHHRGMFLVRCRSSSSVSPPDTNNNNNNNHHHNGYSNPDDSDLPPPPPPARGPRDGWPQVKERGPAVDLPLLRFGSLLPADGYMEPREGGKM